MSGLEYTVITQMELTQMGKEIVTAYLRHNKISPDELPGLINNTYKSLLKIVSVGSDFQIEQPPTNASPPAVTIKKSVHEDYIICLEDGKKLKMLKRHLRTAFGLSPDEYRAKWGLPPDYPMVAPAYARERSKLAKSFGLGASSKGRPRGRRSTSSE